MLDISASDSGAGSLTSYSKVIVNVVDVNDNEPTVQINTLTSSGEAHVTENAPIGTFIAHVTVSDADHGSNGVVKCSIDTNNVFALQTISDSELKLVTATVLDREVVAKHDVSISCSDAGIPPRILTRQLNVLVDDQNDNNPTFTQPTYTIKYEEGNAVSAFITRVSATDADDGPNGVLTYSIHDLDLVHDMGYSQGSPTAYIDPGTDIVRANVVFDFERQTTHTYLVIAVDSGRPPLSGSTTFVLQLVDALDDAPMFDESRYTFQVSENSPAGTYVGQVQASLPPSRDASDSVTYSLVPLSGLPSSVFKVDTHSGHVTTTKALDRETQTSHHLRVMATSIGQPVVVNTADVTINIDDVNDNSPVFIFPTRVNNTVTVPWAAYVSYCITTIVAMDADTHGNALVTYAVDVKSSDHAANVYFHLDDVTGRLTVDKPLSDLIDGQSTYVEVIARDSGQPHRETHSGLHVIVIRGKEAVKQHTTGGLSVALVAGETVYMLLVLIASLSLMLLCATLTWCCCSSKRLTRSQSDSKSKEIVVFQDTCKSLKSSRDCSPVYRQMECRVDKFNGDTYPVTNLVSFDSCTLQAKFDYGHTLVLSNASTVEVGLNAIVKQVSLT